MSQYLKKYKWRKLVLKSWEQVWLQVFYNKLEPDGTEVELASIFRVIKRQMCYLISHDYSYKIEWSLQDVNLNHWLCQLYSHVINVHDTFYRPGPLQNTAEDFTFILKQWLIKRNSLQCNSMDSSVYGMTCSHWLPVRLFLIGLYHIAAEFLLGIR